MAASSTSAYRRLAVATIAVLFIISIVVVLSFASNHHQPWPEKKNEHTNNNNNRRLSESSSSSVTQHEHHLEHVLHLATRTAEDTFTEGGDDDSPFRVLVIVTTLAEYDKGTRGTTHGADRLKDNVLPILVDGVTSMINRGWAVDVYLICGFETLSNERKQMIQNALPPNVGLEVWTDMQYHYIYYVKKFNGR